MKTWPFPAGHEPSHRLLVQLLRVDDLGSYHQINVLPGFLGILKAIQYLLLNGLHKIFVRYTEDGDRLFTTVMYLTEMVAVPNSEPIGDGNLDMMTHSR